MESNQERALREACFKALLDWTPNPGTYNRGSGIEDHYAIVNRVFREPKICVQKAFREYIDILENIQNLLSCNSWNIDQPLLRKYLLAFLAELWQIDYDGD